MDHSLTVRAGDGSDAGAVLGMLDGAVAWLTALGRTGQWGTTPFSAIPARVAMIAEFTAEPGRLFVADLDGQPAGALAVGAAPEHIPPVCEPELYVNLLVTDRAYAGRGVGAALTAHARDLTLARGLGLLRVDCYAGDDRALVRRYVALGFTPTDGFTVERPGMPPWPGQVLAMRP
jgi:GNAT superfamily N-acetyltransferase